MFHRKNGPSTSCPPTLIRLPVVLLVVLLLGFLSTPESFARVSGLLLWEENGVNVILPNFDGPKIDGPKIEDLKNKAAKIDDKTNMASIPTRYKSALERSDSYRKFRPFFGPGGSIAESFEPGQLGQPGQATLAGKISVPPDFKTSPQAKGSIPFALYANNPTVMNPKGRPFQNFTKWLGAAGATVYIIPFGIETLLTDKDDLKAYFGLLSKQFPALISAGGADLDPSLYGEKNKYAFDLNLPRDQSELQLIRDFVTTGQGVFYGVCRGHQAYAVAMGGKLIQDLPVLLSPNVIHRPTKNSDGSTSSSWHPITLSGKNNALYESLEKDSFLVNSRHHQAVESIPPGKGEIIALAGGNVIEAIEKKDSQGQLKVLTFQFHPEDMENSDSGKIVKLMVDQARQVSHIASP